MTTWRDDPAHPVGRYCVASEDSIRTVMLCIDRNASGIALVVDGHLKLLSVVTDGDIRRAILAGIDLDLPVQAALDLRAQVEEYRGPVTAPAGSSPEQLRALMEERSVRQVPLVNAEGRVAGLVTDRDVLSREPLPVTAVVVAGGLGQRLRPLTESTPKPLLPIGDRPLMQHTIERLTSWGISRLVVSTRYHADKIKQHFGDGRRYGVEISYLTESQPLGTAGALREIADTGRPLLVINGDIITRTDFGAMYRFHRDREAVLTVGVKEYNTRVPYGVIETRGDLVLAVLEKPKKHFLVNAGIYVVEHAALRHIPASDRFDMTDLIAALCHAHQRVVAFPICEYWLDVGQPADYEQAQHDFADGRF